MRRALGVRFRRLSCDREPHQGQDNGPGTFQIFRLQRFDADIGYKERRAFRRRFPPAAFPPAVERNDRCPERADTSSGLFGDRGLHAFCGMAQRQSKPAVHGDSRPCPDGLFHVPVLGHKHLHEQLGHNIPNDNKRRGDVPAYGSHNDACPEFGPQEESWNGVFDAKHNPAGGRRHRHSDPLHRPG